MAGCYNTRPAGVRVDRETGLGGELIPHLGELIAVLRCLVSISSRFLGSLACSPSNIPNPDLIMGTNVILLGETVSVW